MITGEGVADPHRHEFRLPSAKVTKRGGRAAPAFKRRLFGQIVAAAVRATEGADIPVTVKFRVASMSPPHIWMPAASLRPEGAAAVALRPARPAIPAPPSCGTRIARLKRHVGRFRCSAATSTMPATHWP